MGEIVGCDIGKAWIDIEVVRGEHRRSVRIANQRGAIKRFVQTLAQGSFVGMEATGQLHVILADTLHEHGHTVFVLNCRWVRQYARALGVRGKTDRTDAALIARFVGAEAKGLHPYVPPSPSQRELRHLLLQRRELVKLRAATVQSMGNAAKGVESAFKKLIARIEARVNELIRADPMWHELRQRLQSVPGIGPVAGAYLVQVLTRYDFKNSDAVVAHSGLDPRPHESGQRVGRRRLSHHGDAGLRSLLYTSAMTACRRPEWRNLYARQMNKGLPSTAALLVIARKLVRIAFTLFRTGNRFDPQRLRIA